MGKIQYSRCKASYLLELDIDMHLNWVKHLKRMELTLMSTFRPVKLQKIRVLFRFLTLISKVLCTVERLFRKSEVLTEMHQKGKNLIDGRGTNRIVDSILKVDTYL